MRFKNNGSVGWLNQVIEGGPSSICAFTRIELLVVVGLLALLAILMLPAWNRARMKADRISCVSHLKCIGTGYRIWAGDHNGFYRSQSTNGWLNRVTSSNAGTFCWTNYVVMAAGLGQSPHILICPADVRTPAADLRTNQSVGFSNTNVSYFVGISAGDSYPQSVLGGDRNLGPGPQASNDFGFSPPDGSGADVVISTNSSKNTLVWSLKMHSAGNPLGAGNLLMGDGSVQQCSSGRFRLDYQPNAGTWPTTGPGLNTCIRLVFP